MTAMLVDQRRDVERKILDEFSRLSIPEQLTIIESMLQRVRKELQRTSPNRIERQRQLAIAAEALLSDYLEDTELTAFTALDGEDFYAEG